MASESRDKNTPAQSSLAVVAAMLCLGCILFFIAATIVLALIPVFLATKNLTPNPNALKSNRIQAIFGIDDGSTSSGRRKRQSSNTTTNMSVAALEGGYFSDTGKTVFKATLIKYLPKSIVSDIIIDSATIISNPDTTSAASGQHTCQLEKGTSLKANLKNIPSTKLNLGSILFVLANGTTEAFTIIFGGYVYVSDIHNGIDPDPSNILTTIATNVTSVLNTTIASNTSNGTSG